MTTLHIADPLPPGGGDTQAAPLDGHLLLAQLGREVAGSLSPALERVQTLTATGRIDRQSLRALRDEVDLARRAGLVGQQLARLSRGKVALAHVRFDLGALLQDALAQRRHEMDTRHIDVRPLLVAADVVSDADLLSTLLQAALDWSFEHAAGRIDIWLELQGWPAHARMRSAFAYRADAVTGAADNGTPAAPVGAVLDTLSWRLLEQLALVLGLALRRRDVRGRTELLLDFPPAPAAATDRPVLPPRVAPAASLEPPHTAGPAADATPARPLAGFHVLVLAPRREVRAQVRDALRDMDLLLDFVTSVDEARLFCAEALPQAVVYDASEDTAEFARLRDTLLAQQPTLGLIQITDAGRAFDMLSLGARDYASVGRDGLMESLPAALMFELFRDS